MVGGTAPPYQQIGTEGIIKGCCIWTTQPYGGTTGVTRVAGRGTVDL